MLILMYMQVVPYPNIFYYLKLYNINIKKTYCHCGLYIVRSGSAVDDPVSSTGWFATGSLGPRGGPRDMDMAWVHPGLGI